MTEVLHRFYANSQLRSGQRVECNGSKRRPASNWSAPSSPTLRRAAGNHSDIGGSYPENESRLSDIALKWKVEEAEHPAIGLKVDHRVLALWASPGGMQHDETRRGLFQYSGKMDRDPVKDATVHESVVERFKLRSVLDFDSTRPYRPGCLAQHERVIHFYDADVLIDQFAEEGLLEAMRRSREALAVDHAVEAEHWRTVAGEIQRRLSEFKN